MKADYTHIAIILDRTGSMNSIRDDTIGGFNVYLDKQKQGAGTATLTLVQFDSQDPYEVIHRFKPVADVPPLTPETYVPRANTPLYDAMGRGINDLAATLAGMAEADRPEQVMFVVVTDGEENASSEFTKAQVSKMIAEKQDQDKWEFVFLSADFTAFQEAGDMGVMSSKRMMMKKSSRAQSEVWDMLSEKTSAYRSSKKSVEFTDDDRNKADMDD